MPQKICKNSRNLKTTKLKSHERNIYTYITKQKQGQCNKN